MTQNVSAVFDTRDQAADGVRRLKDSGFSEHEFTVVARADELAEAQAQAARATEQEAGHGGAWAGTALGAAIGGGIALFSIALIPALPLLVAGGAAAGAAAGDVISRFGTGQIENEMTQRILHAGGALIVVHTDSKTRAEAARDALIPASTHTIAIESY